MPNFTSLTDSFTLNSPVRGAQVKTPHDFAEQLTQAIKGFEQLGANINPASRLYEYARAIENTQNQESSLADVVHAEAMQFIAIYEALSKLEDPSPWLPKLSSAAGGRIDAKDDKPDSKARSDQAELFAMANLLVAGFAVSPEEPDLRARIGSTDVAFAVKRLRTESKLGRNLRDARRQLARHQVPGFVFLDISFIEAIGKPIYVSRLEQRQALAKVMIDGFAERHFDEMLKQAKHPTFLGVIVHGAIACRAVQPLSIAASRRIVLCAPAHTESGMKLIESLQRIGLG